MKHIETNVPVLAIFLICLLLICCSSENERDKKRRDNARKVLNHYSNIFEGSIKYKIDLLCLKHGVSSTKLKGELVDYIKSQDLTIQILKDTQQGKEIDKEKLITGEKDLNKLISISKQNNVPVKTLASIIYDYEIWNSIWSENE